MFVDGGFGLIDVSFFFLESVSGVIVLLFDEDDCDVFIFCCLFFWEKKLILDMCILFKCL